MDTEKLAKIFEETDSEFRKSEKFLEIVRDFEKIAEKHGTNLATVMTSFELSQHFLFAVIKKVLRESEQKKL